jgi:hypothetical protein
MDLEGNVTRANLRAGSSGITVGVVLGLVGVLISLGLPWHFDVGAVFLYTFATAFSIYGAAILYLNRRVIGGHTTQPSVPSAGGGFHSKGVLDTEIRAGEEERKTGQFGAHEYDPKSVDPYGHP